jgi:hypothetical protein
MLAPSYGGSMKSHVSVLLSIATSVITDAVAKCADVHLDVRDVLTLTSRVKHEGLSFLTITLPSMGSDLEQALAEGNIGTNRFRSFKKRGKAPAFMQGFFSQVFDNVGRIYDEPSIPAIEGLRQIAYTFKKLEIACSPSRVNAVLTKFVENEQALNVPLALDDIAEFGNVSRVIWNDVFPSGDNLLGDITPKHGPGATAEKLSGNAKFQMLRWHDRLEPYFPVLDNAFATVNAMSSPEFEKLSIISKDGEQPVRVIPVPKTLKGPRIIAIEPVCMQYTQQGLSKWLVKALKASKLTSGHINFDDQSVNRRLAITSSGDGKMSTLDMSSASDLVPYDLAISMFDSVPDIRDAISACRSTKAQMPSGEILSLSKFASMGSALCFPVEAMYFYTLCVMALLKKRNLPTTSAAIRSVGRHIYVYGDDIIVPTHESDIVTSTLQKYHCKVNVLKSFSSGKFRESCGMDAYDGEEVTPTYLRQMPPDDKQNAKALISWLASSNLFYQRGYWQTSSILLKRVEGILGNLPVVLETCAGLGKISFQRRFSVERLSPTLHRPEVKAWTATPIYVVDQLNGYPALLKCLLSLEAASKGESPKIWSDDRRETEPAPKDDKHLERSARHGAVTLKRRWVSPY